MRRCGRNASAEAMRGGQAYRLFRPRGEQRPGPFSVGQIQQVCLTCQVWLKVVQWHCFFLSFGKTWLESTFRVIGCPWGHRPSRPSTAGFTAAEGQKWGALREMAPTPAATPGTLIPAAAPPRGRKGARKTEFWYGGVACGGYHRNAISDRGKGEIIQWLVLKDVSGRVAKGPSLPRFFSLG